ncbi:MAG: helix-hairpin-helix domain-containing protein [Gammaproteobacteria bacterium]|nr:helix-hairpin-helix domain-containing protein [Gammaproteobacteria bacterium]
MLTDQKIQNIASQSLLLGDLSDDELAEFCVVANQYYRDGKPIVTDQDYDFVFLAELSSRVPNHFLLARLEPENEGFSGEKVRLPERMLSTDKAYSWAEIQKWLNRINKASEEINLPSEAIQIKGTAKLDGFAGYDDGMRLYTRGDGNKGSDITRVFERGLGVYNDSERGQGPGEIVVKKSYFESRLSQHFEYPRNFQASLIKEKSLDRLASQAIADKAALFVPFCQLPSWSGNTTTFSDNFQSIVRELEGGVDFDVDGVVFELTNDQLKAHMGSNRKFHRWQIAFKENKDKAQVRVLSITAQVGRTGKITPVAELEPTQLSGATIYRATGHHYGLVREQGLGAGSVVELTRSGLVIPKINKVLKRAEVSIPESCPSCQSKLTWDSDFLMCLNHDDCPDQIIGTMVYFFKILANNDGFGAATVQKFYENGIRKISGIYQLSHDDLTTMGFGDKTSQNLLDQLKRSKEEGIEDWRFLAAFGVLRLGMGNCENLLKHKSIGDVFDLSVDDIVDMDGFAELTAKLIIGGLEGIKAEYQALRVFGFRLETTQLKSDMEDFDHPFFNKKVVFTGKMSHPRADLQRQAKSLGIKVTASVNNSTDFLIIGEKVGVTKLNAAKEKDVVILKEADYLSKIENFYYKVNKSVK